MKQPQQGRGTEEREQDETIWHITNVSLTPLTVDLPQGSENFPTKTEGSSSSSSSRAVGVIGRAFTNKKPSEAAGSAAHNATSWPAPVYHFCLFFCLPRLCPLTVATVPMLVVPPRMPTFAEA